MTYWKSGRGGKQRFAGRRSSSRDGSGYITAAMMWPVCWRDCTGGGSLAGCGGRFRRFCRGPGTGFSRDSARRAAGFHGTGDRDMDKNENADGINVPQEQVAHKSNLARARDKWLESGDGVKCCQGSTQGRFLKNRIECAFVAGWNFCGELIEKGIRDGCQN